jgi:hypothetical protein
MKQRSLFIMAVATGLLAAGAAWSYGHMASQRQAAEAARADLAQCLASAATIETLRQKPALASDQERVAAETTGLVSRAAAAAGITPAQLARIVPDPPQKIGQTAYKEKPTLVVVEDVRLEQIVKMIHTLGAGTEGLTAKSIRLGPPRQQGCDDLWTAEIVLTYLIYDPAQAPKEGAKP